MQISDIRNQVIGLIRFSIVTEGEFYPGFGSTDDLERFIFDPARLERRFEWFERLCLPSLVNQTDPDFLCVLLIGEAMPDAYKERILKLSDLADALVVMEMPRDYHYSGIKKALNFIPKDGYTHRTTFRLDDDDAVDLEFIARLKGLVPKALDACGIYNPTAIAFNRGFYLEMREDKNVIWAQAERTPMSIGTALVTPVSNPENIYQFNHRQLNQYHNAVTDARTYGWIRTVHQDNKSEPKRTGMKIELSNKEIDEILREKFGVKLGDLRHLKIG